MFLLDNKLCSWWHNIPLPASWHIFVFIRLMGSEA